MSQDGTWEWFVLRNSDSQHPTFLSKDFVVWNKRIIFAVMKNGGVTGTCVCGIRMK